MKSNNPRPSRKSSKPDERPLRNGGTHWAAALAVAVTTVLSFLPVLQNEFVDWDDYENLVNNANYRGLGWSQLRWMFTTFHMGHYQPLSWMSLGLDYLIWGMNPAGYHLTNLVLHAANAVFFYFVSRRLLVIALSLADDEKSWQLSLSAAFAALLFALHPLRVESVAWATERRDILSGFFFLGTVYCYLRAGLTPHRRRWLWTAVTFCALSLLAKATAITLPAILLLLDIYPLRRWRGGIRDCFNAQNRSLWVEKIPFLILASLFAVIALLAQHNAGALRPVQQYGVMYRIGQGLYGVNFYLWKTLLPGGLSPLYELPLHFGQWTGIYVLSGSAVFITALGLYVLRRRWPAVFACWLYYVAVLVPVVGIAQSGPQLVAERYSYLSCLGWAVLAGGLLCNFLRVSVQQRKRSLALFAAPVAAIVILVMLASLTWQQTAIWRDSGTLWSHVLKIDPNSSFAHYNLARFLAQQGNHTDAISHYRQALTIQPADADAHNNLGLLLAIEGEVDASLREFQAAVQIDPGYSRAFFNLGRVFARQGELEKATQNYHQALKLSPDEFEIHLGLGNVLIRQGRVEDAAAHFQEAVGLNPNSADAHVALARSLASLGKKEEAENQYQQALQLLRLQKKSPPNHS